MKKNIIWVLLIFIVPIAAYWGLSRTKLPAAPAIASQAGCEIIKFSSPMCYECQQLEEVFNEVFPKYNENISLRKIDVTKRDKNTQTLLKQYDVQLVPTTVFKKADGTTKRVLQGTVEPKDLEMYIEELING